MADVDLTPFGFTPTENRAYGALLDLGPCSGYALAKALSIARANAYQALNGLVAKGAATSSDDQPQRYRAERPDAILARIIDAQTRRLDVLESQIQGLGQPSGATIVQLRGTRGLLDVALRTLAREQGQVTCVGTSDLIAALGPAWHRRAMDSRPSAVWIIGQDPGDLPVDPRGSIDETRAEVLFGGAVFLLLAGDVAVIAKVGESTSGYWTTDPAIRGAVKGVAVHLVEHGLSSKLQ